MFLSIIIPSYNCEKFINECISSCLTQTFGGGGDYEIICVDDGSTDNTLSCLETFHSRVNFTVIKNNHNGASCARNSGLRIAQGDYIWFVDADDLIVPQAIEILYNKVQQSNSDRILFNFCSFGNEFFGKGISNIIQFNEKNCYEGYCWLSIYKKDFLINNNIQFRDKIIFGEDEVFNYELKKTNHSFYYLDEVLYCHRIHSSSLMSTLKDINSCIVRIDSIIESMYILKKDVDDLKLNSAIDFFMKRQQLLKFLIAKLPHKKYREYVKMLKKNKLFSKEYFYVKKDEKYIKGNFLTFKISLLKIRLYYILKKKIIK